MPNGLYLSAAGANVQSQRLEVLANNVANVDTVGFKRELAVFQARNTEAIDQGLDIPGFGTVNDTSGGVFLRSTETDYSPGPVKKTDIKTDAAIDGDGFFVIAKDDEQLLTRAGNFTLTPDGQLVTQTGLPVLSTGGLPITFDPNQRWYIRHDGVVQTEAEAIPIAIVKPAHVSDMAKAGENLFRPLAETTPVEPQDRRVHVGFLEMSGANPTQEMMELIEASRAFEANVRMIQNQDDVLGSLVGRLLRA